MKPVVLSTVLTDANQPSWRSVPDCLFFLSTKPSQNASFSSFNWKILLSARLHREIYWLHFSQLLKQRKICWGVRSHNSNSPEAAKQVSSASTLIKNNKYKVQQFPTMNCWNYHCSFVPVVATTVFLISAVNFSFPTCSTAFRITIHHYSLSSINHAATHCACFFIPLLLPLSSKHISLSVPVLAQYFRVRYLEHKINTNDQTQFSIKLSVLFHKYSLLCANCVICLNSCIRYTFNKIKTCNVCT